MSDGSIMRATKGHLLSQQPGMHTIGIHQFLRKAKTRKTPPKLTFRLQNLQSWSDNGLGK